jgi:hypothetical protein
MEGPLNSAAGRPVETNLIQNMEMEIGAGGQTVKF